MSRPGETRRSMRAWMPHPQSVLLFWEVVESFTAGERTQLLAWARGSSALPPTGFRDLSFLLRRDPRGSGRLPTAHTCEFAVDLPDCSTKHELEGNIRRALVEVRFFIA
mmetsp:Transcript_27064/g.60937  ORF Transcript_27064/g.60937 Transcript_27064/m.60937 type:complete len:109 (-) Transcript_27064:86-412(-)